MEGHFLFRAVLLVNCFAGGHGEENLHVAHFNAVGFVFQVQSVGSVDGSVDDGLFPRDLVPLRRHGAEEGGGKRF